MSGYFAALERELVSAAGRRGPRRRRGRGTVLLAAALLAAAGGTAAAVTGTFDRRDEVREIGRLFRSAPIAEGTTSNGARWQLLASDAGGRFCFGIAMPSADPQMLRPGGGATCGRREPGILTIEAASGGPGRRYGPRHSLALGTAPDAAVSVEITVGKGKLTVPTFDDPKGIEGRFYVTGIPLRWQRQRRHVRAFDASGNVIARAGG
jgi:hypothetical protein